MGGKTKSKFPQSSITMRKNKEYISDAQQKIIELHELVKYL